MGGMTAVDPVALHRADHVRKGVIQPCASDNYSLIKFLKQQIM
jgi:hypothetical protein